MSYLLTEIALEMLGYKFYDIYGVQDDINNFQNLAAAEHSTNDCNTNEPHLGSILGLNSTSTADTKNTKHNNANQSQKDGEVCKIYLSDSVTKSMDVEYNKVRQQLLRSKPTLSMDNRLDPKTTQTMIQQMVETEHEKLKLEQKNLQSFRRLVEETVMQMNPTTFEKYCDTFKWANRSPRSTVIKK